MLQDWCPHPIPWRPFARKKDQKWKWQRFRFFWSVHHQVTGENNVQIQDFIRRSGKAEILVGDISEMEQSALLNLFEGKSVVRPASTLAICGWVCHDATRRNPKRSKNCIKDIGGGTGETFHGFIRYLKECQPRFFYGEMAWGTLGTRRQAKNDYRRR